MTFDLVQGANLPLPSPRLRVRVGCAPGGVPDTGGLTRVYVMDVGGRCLGAATPCGDAVSGVVAGADAFEVDLDALPPGAERVAFVALLPETGPAAAWHSRPESLVLEVVGVARYEAPVPETGRPAIVLGEVYRRGSGWKLKAVGQGFAAGEAALEAHFGFVPDPTSRAAAPPDSASPSPAAGVRGGVDLAERDPELFERSRAVRVVLAKKPPLVADRAQVALVLDISASMARLYRSGRVQAFLDRAMAVAHRFDDDGRVEVFLFGERAHHAGAAGLDDYRGFVAAALARHPFEGGTRYGEVMRLLRAHFRARPGWGRRPVYVMFLTDGGTQDQALTERMIVESSAEPIFWCFMAIGQARRSFWGGRAVLPEGFEFLARLDDMPGRRVDNADFFSVADPSGLPDEEMYGLLMGEFPRWQAEAHRAGLFA